MLFLAVKAKQMVIGQNQIRAVQWRRENLQSTLSYIFPVDQFWTFQLKCAL